MRPKLSAYSFAERAKISIRSKMTLLTALRTQGFVPEAPCGGKRKLWEGRVMIDGQPGAICLPDYH